MGGQVNPRAFMMKPVFVPLPDPGAPTEKDDLLRKAQVLEAKFLNKPLPDRGENHLGILDFHFRKVCDWGGFVSGSFISCPCPRFTLPASGNREKAASRNAP